MNRFYMYIILAQKSLLASLLLVTSLMSVAPLQAEIPPAIVPSPTSMAMGSGDTTMSSANTIYYSDSALGEVAALLKQEMLLVHGLDLDVRLGNTVGGADILLRLNPSLPNTEKYRLTVEGSITLESRGVAGIYAGTVSILQVVTIKGRVKRISNMTVVDEPVRPFRGVMVDIKNQWHSVDQIKQMIRLCRFYKVNFLSLHTGEEQWIGAVMDQTAGLSGRQRQVHRLYTRTEMEEIIAFARGQGVNTLPHNESSRTFKGMHKALSHDFNPADDYANFMDEYDGQGAYTGDFNDVRYWNFIREVTRRSVDQFKAGYASSRLPYYHIGPVQGEGGMNRKDAARIIGFIREKDPQVKTMFWNGIDGRVQDDLSALKAHIVISYYQRWGGSDIRGYLDNGWTVLNAAWSPLYVVGSGLARTQAQVFKDWNLFRTGTDGFRGGGFAYDAIKWINFEQAQTQAQVIGGMLCTWEVPADIHLERLRLRVPAFVEHAWQHQAWPYPAEDYSEFSTCFASTDAYLTRFLMRAEVPSLPTGLCATDRVFADRIVLNWRASDNNPTGYALYRSTNSGPASARRIATVSGTTYTDTQVAADTTYTYWVRAVNAFGETDLSEPAAGRLGTSNPPACAYEPFDYATGASIHGQQGGSAWTSPWEQTSANGACEINTYGLGYGELPVSGRSIRLHAAADKPAILFNRRVKGNMGLAGTSTWTSFLLKCHKQGNGHLFVGFNTINAGKRWGSQIAIENNSTATNVAQGDTYFIVCQVVNRPGKDDAYLWVNPELEQRPLQQDADLKLTTIDMTEAGRVLVNNQGYGQGSYDIDEIRIGIGWQDVIGGLGR